MQASGTLLRGGLVSGITLGGGESAQDVLFGVLAIVLAGGGPAGAALPFGTAHPSASAYAFTRLRMLGMPDSANCVRVQAEYSTFSGSVNSAYILTRRTKTITVETNMHPVTRQPIVLSYWKNEETVSTQIIPDDWVNIRVRMPCDSITVDEVIYGSLDDSRASYIGYVNDRTWKGRDIANWLFDDYYSSYYRYQGYYTRHSELLTPGPAPKDWSEFAVLRSSITGKIAIPNDDAQTRVNMLLAKTYNFTTAIDFPGMNDGRDGICRVYPYPVANFFNIFGFQ